MIPDLLAIVFDYCKLDALDVFPMLSSTYCVCGNALRSYSAMVNEGFQRRQDQQKQQREIYIEHSATVCRNDQRKQEIRRNSFVFGRERPIRMDKLSRRKRTSSYK